MSGDHDRNREQRANRRTYLRRAAAVIGVSGSGVVAIGTGRTGRAARHGSGTDRTAITAPTRITEPGEYVLTGDLEVPEEDLGIVVDVDGVDLDGGGHTITGGRPAVLVFDHDVVVRDLTVADSRFGIVLDGTRNGTVVDTTVVNPELGGIQLSATSNTTVRRNTITDATTGLVCFEADRNLLAENVVTGCERSGIDLLDSTVNVVSENVSIRNGEHGLLLTNAEENAILGNVVQDNGFGPCSAVDSSENVFEGNDPECDGEDAGTDATPGPLV
jgi:parallel beta-helix repeat protein